MWGVRRHRAWRNPSEDFAWDAVCFNAPTSQQCQRWQYRPGQKEADVEPSSLVNESRLDTSLDANELEPDVSAGVDPPQPTASFQTNDLVEASLLGWLAIMPRIRA